MAQGTECFRVPDETHRTHPSPDKDRLRALGAHFFVAPLRRCVEAMSLFGIVMCQHKRGTAGVRGGTVLIGSRLVVSEHNFREFSLPALATLVRHLRQRMLMVV